MSLLVWLPMTKDLRQQGLSNIAVTNHNVTIDTNGKLGSCCYFNGNQQWLQFNTVLGDYYNNDWSIACWLKPTDSTRSIIISEYNGTGASNVAIELTTARIVRLYWASTPDINFSTAGALPLNEWTHIVMTKAGRVVKLYFNGELKQTYTSSSDFSTRTSACQPRIGDDYRGNSGSTVSYQGYMNDFRMYDHCLSEMEIKQLSQGLVLHYPLSDNSVQQLNNCYTNPTFNSSSASAGWSHWGSSGNKGTYGQNTDSNYIYRANQSYSHWVADGADATKSFLVYQSPAFEGGQRSLQCICKEENSLPINESIVMPAWNARNGGTPNEQWTSITSLGNGFYHCKCENIQQSGSDDLVGFYVRPGYKVYFSEAYLENDKECCSNIFYSTNVIYDTSGFCNNGSAVGTFTISSNTPKYNVSTKFSTNTIKDTTFNFTSNTWTVAFWYYFDTAPSAYQGFLCLSRNAGSDVDKKFAAMPNSSYIWFKFENTNLTVSSLKTKAWTHIAMTFDGTNGKVYENGVLKSTTSAASSIYTNCDDFVVGARASAVDATATTCQLVGDMSDVRIYATALSASDVKSLYQNCATIDPDGTIRGQIRS